MKCNIIIVPFWYHLSFSFVVPIGYSLYIFSCCTSLDPLQTVISIMDLVAWMQALVFVLALMVRAAANRAVEYDSDDEYIRQPLMNRQGVPPVLGTLDHRPSRNDAWSQRMREKVISVLCRNVYAFLLPVPNSPFVLCSFCFNDSTVLIPSSSHTNNQTLADINKPLHLRQKKEGAAVAYSEHLNLASSHAHNPLVGLSCNLYNLRDFSL